MQKRRIVVKKEVKKLTKQKKVKQKEREMKDLVNFILDVFDEEEVKAERKQNKKEERDEFEEYARKNLTLEVYHMFIRHVDKMVNDSTDRDIKLVEFVLKFVKDFTLKY